MFTGLVAELGSVERLTEDGSRCQLTVRARKILPEVKIGDSIAVNGVCLTVIHLRSNGFTADVMPETVRRTTLHALAPGDRVNLERALRPADGLDGHIVQGHVEGIGRILSVTQEGNALLYQLAAPQELLRYIVEKGSVAIDGISLTVIRVDEEGFEVSLIPHTAKMTTLGYKTAGDMVNLETDILARYVEKMLGTDCGEEKAAPRYKKAFSRSGGGASASPGPDMDKTFLLENGF